jgi:serine/threonine protein kinase
MVVPGPPEVGELRLSGVLGSGAFGIVFEAMAMDGTSRFAVKFLQAGILASAGERQALLNEVLAAREIKHPNVLPLLHVGEESGLPPYLVIEFADSGTLQMKIQKARQSESHVPLELVKKWSLDLMSALSAINARIIHRDVKPDNILFVGDVLKVADFGLAKLVGAATRSVTFKGGQHILYMAPEAWEGQRNEIQIDMYALGIVLFEMATLRYPYKQPDLESLDAFRRMHLLESPASARTLRPDLPLRYEEVLTRLMSKRPESRYVNWELPREAVRAAFDTAPSLVVAPVNELLEQASISHRKDLERRAAEEAERRRAAEELEIDRMQEEEIVGKLRAIIEQFNKGTEGPQASLNEFGGRWSLSFPYAKSATLSFFPAEPPLQLSAFTVRHVALLADSQGCGFNLLLRRRANETYGVWVVCRVRMMPGSGYEHPHCTYFGLGPDEVEHIERGLRAIHIYVPTVSEDVDTRLNEFVKSLYLESH